MLFKGPKSLLDSITNIIKEDRVQYAKEQNEMDKLVAEKMLSPKQKKIASMAGHPEKMDAADFAALRAGKQVKEASDMPEKPFKYNKKTGTFDRVKKMEETTDTPGNGREHQCAIHVKSEQFGEGKTLTTQHANPDTEGNIAWYDVMFEHGIERVMTKDIEILVSEAHTHSKKKGMM